MWVGPPRQVVLGSITKLLLYTMSQTESILARRPLPIHILIHGHLRTFARTVISSVWNVLLGVLPHSFLSFNCPCTRLLPRSPGLPVCVNRPLPSAFLVSFLAETDFSIALVLSHWEVTGD